MGSVPVGVQCPLASPIGKFLGYWAGSGILGHRTYWCQSPFPSPSISRCFPFTLHLPLDFIRVFSLRPTYLNPFGRPFVYSLSRLVSRLGSCSGTRCCGPRGGKGVCMEQKSRFKFLPGTLASSGRERYK